MNDAVNQNKHDRTQALASAIKERRESLNLSMRGLAKISTWKYSAISRLENGIYDNPGFYQLLKLTDALELDISSLLKPEWTFPDMSYRGRTLEKSIGEQEFNRIYTIANAIKLRRIELEMSTWKLGEISMMSATTISRIECNVTRNPTLRNILSLIDALSLDINLYNKPVHHPAYCKIKKPNNPRMLLERQFNSILLHRQEVLADYLPTKLQDVKLEKYYDGNMFIDFFGVLENQKLPVFVESQKTTMDGVHFKKIARLIQSIPEGIIIWITTGVKSQYYDELETILKNTGKPIEIKIIEFDKNYLQILRNLEAMRIDEAYKAVLNPAFALPSLKLKRTISTIPSDYVGSYQRTLKNEVEEIGTENQLLLNSLRQKFPYFLNLARGKSNLDTRGIQIGSGINGIEIKLVIACAHKKKASICVRSTNYTSNEVLRSLKLKLHQIHFSSTITETESNFTLNYEEGLSKDEVFSKMHVDFGEILEVIMQFVQK